MDLLEFGYTRQPALTSVTSWLGIYFDHTLTVTSLRSLVASTTHINKVLFSLLKTHPGLKQQIISLFRIMDIVNM